ncbi:MAG: acyltransferase family protein [bacterium]|nr:acyltransferase family protein [bacterium]
MNNTIGADRAAESGGSRTAEIAASDTDILSNPFSLMKDSSSKRVAFFDNAKGLLILLVVMGHLLTYMPSNSSMLMSTAAIWIYTFHMPLFLFIGGIFASKSYSEENEYRGENFLFYMALCLIFALLSLAAKVAMGGELEFNFFNQANSPWYLWVMAVYVLMVPLFARIKPGVILPILVALALCSGFWLDSGNRTLFACAKLIVYCPIFAAGCYIGLPRALRIQERILSSNKVWIVRIVALAVLVAWFAFLYELGPDRAIVFKQMSTGWNEFDIMAERLGGSAWLFIAMRLGFYAWSALIGIAFMLMAPKRKCFLTRWGEHSLQIYILHIIVINVMSHFGFFEYLLGLSHWMIFYPFVLAVILTALIGAPRFLQTWANALKRLCKKAVRPSAP